MMRYSYINGDENDEVAETKSFGAVQADIGINGQIIGIEYPEHLTQDEALERIKL